MTTIGATTPSTVPETQWRTRDIVVAAVIGVAFGVVFWVWGLVWYGPLQFIGELAFPLRDLFYAVWLVPAVLGPLIIRKPGAALFTEMVAAGVSALLGSVWGVDTLLSGFVQGAAAELVFAFTLYRICSEPGTSRSPTPGQTDPPSPAWAWTSSRAPSS
jgi:energy-coupling factor transport system substrate-specific component